MVSSKNLENVLTLQVRVKNVEIKLLVDVDISKKLRRENGVRLLNDNYKFPTIQRSKTPIIDDLDAVKMKEDLDFAITAEGLMINLIHNVGENGFDIKKDRFIGDISFLNEVVRGLFIDKWDLHIPCKSLWI